MFTYMDGLGKSNSLLLYPFALIAICIKQYIMRQFFIRLNGFFTIQGVEWDLRRPLILVYHTNTIPNYLYASRSSLAGA